MIPNSRGGIEECGHKDSVFNEINSTGGGGGGKRKGKGEAEGKTFINW